MKFLKQYFKEEIRLMKIKLRQRKGINKSLKKHYLHDLRIIKQEIKQSSELRTPQEENN